MQIKESGHFLCVHENNLIRLRKSEREKETHPLGQNYLPYALGNMTMCS